MVKFVNKNINIFMKSIKISFKVKNKFSIFISILGFFISTLPAFIAIVLREFTDELKLLYGKGIHNIGPALQLFSFLALLNIILIIFKSIQKYYLTIDAIKVRHFIKETIIRVCCKVKYKYLENFEEFNEKVSFIETHAGQRVANSIQNIIAWLQDFITFFSIIIVLFSVNHWIVILLLVTTIPSIYLAYKQKDEDFKTNTKYMKEGNWVVFKFKQLCDKYAMKEIRYFGLFSYLKSQWREKAKEYAAKKNVIVRKYFIYNSISDILRNGVYIFVLLIVARTIFDFPSIGLGTFMLVFTLSSELQNVTAHIFIGIAQFINDKQYMEAFFFLENLEFEEYDSNAIPFTKTDIKFLNVNFKYPNSQKYALKDIDITIKQGEKVAVVGENGSGKTTFVNLLCAMYEPDDGVVTIDGKKVTDNISKTRRSISAMFQNFGKYEASIRQNIIVSDYDRECNDKILVDLTKKTGVYDFIKEKPHQFDEVVGTVKNDNNIGNDLSGGQWQKLAISRALYRDKARIMILDEPTSALDPMAEAELYRNFTELTNNRTVILISHRLGIAPLVDRILVFDKGSIVEEGTHDELIKKEGLYSKMYMAQAQWYTN